MTTTKPPLNLSKGHKLDSGFVILDIVNLDELQATGVWARHEKSGAEVFHIHNDDRENLFAFAFATAPQDDTGAAHILEHSVLCGSQHYPLKDAFLVLAQGSLQTFLNAWTFPDKTVYPASSVNEHDYFNLMSVYGDAVFRPLLSENTFMQEGHRLELSADTNSLTITGVVYNEMKGAYSSLESYSGLWSVKAVLPDTPYAFESGGSPQHIPSLTWEGLKEFHRRRYAPANCRVFLAGNIPTEKQLAFLNEQFFSQLDSGTAAPPLPKQPRWDTPKQLVIPCPAGTKPKATAFLSWLCCDNTELNERLELAVLADILLGHDGSPLLRAMIEAGIGEDQSPATGIESELHEMLFVAGLRGIAPATDGGATITDTARRLQAVILGELQRLVTEGIPPQEIEAAMLSMEFSQREIRRAGGPFSLIWMRRSLRGWLHGGTPLDNLLFTPHMDRIKRELAENPRYFETLIQKHLLNNPHRALVILEPQEDFLKKEEERLARSLAETRQQMSAAEQAALAEKSAALATAQNQSDSPQALAAIPHLSRSDLSAEVEPIPRRLENLGGVPALCHEAYTNGITYIDLAFPVDTLPPPAYLWLPFFARAVISVGLPGMNYAEVSSLLARTVGGLNAMLHTTSAAGSKRSSAEQTPPGIAGRDWLMYRMRCLDEKTADSLDLVLRLITETDFSDTRRIRDLTLEMRNEYTAAFAPSGHHYAAGRAGRFSSRSNGIDELWGGIDQMGFAYCLAESDITEICSTLSRLREGICASGVIANLTGSAAALQQGSAAVAERFSRFGSPVAAAEGFTPQAALAETGIATANAIAALATPRAEVFASPSLQVGFAALALEAAPFDTPAQAAEIVLAHQLSTGALWEDIRMKGGAYGAFANSDSLERCFSLTTYRDPDPRRSLDTCAAVLQKLAREGGGHPADAEHAEDELVKSIIGCYAKETRPHPGAENGSIDFFRFLSNVEDSCRGRKLQRLAAVTRADITAAVRSLAAQSVASPVIIAGMKQAEAAAKVLGTDLCVLPV